MKHLLFPTLLLFLSLLLSPFSVLAEQNSCKCCSTNHNAFDFWLGNWSVTATGKPAGINQIDKIQNGCIVRENWVSATPGYTGTSYNFYNAEKEQWQQIWIDNQGGSLELFGNRVGNQMILRSVANTDKHGKESFQRITWTLNDDKSVRQLWETITMGKDSKVAFDGLYQRSN